MSDDPNKNVLDYLRAQFDRVHLRLERIEADVSEIKTRLTLVETQLGQFVATEQSHYAVIMLRIDGFERRLDRIEKRLDLVDTPAA